MLQSFSKKVLSLILFVFTSLSILSFFQNCTNAGFRSSEGMKGDFLQLNTVDKHINIVSLWPEGVEFSILSGQAFTLALNIEHNVGDYSVVWIINGEEAETLKDQKTVDLVLNAGDAVVQNVTVRVKDLVSGEEDIEALNIHFSNYDSNGGSISFLLHSQQQPDIRASILDLNQFNNLFSGFYYERSPMVFNIGVSTPPGVQKEVEWQVKRYVDTDGSKSPETIVSEAESGGVSPEFTSHVIPINPNFFTIPAQDILQGIYQVTVIIRDLRVDSLLEDLVVPLNPFRVSPRLIGGVVSANNDNIIEVSGVDRTSTVELLVNVEFFHEEDMGLVKYGYHFDGSDVFIGDFQINAQGDIESMSANAPSRTVGISIVPADVFLNVPAGVQQVELHGEFHMLDERGYSPMVPFMIRLVE